MIKNYDVKKRITIGGESADLYLAISAIGIPTMDAHAVNEQFDKFLTIINGTAPEKRPPVLGAPTNFGKGKWTDAEKAAVLSVPEEDAWQNYHKIFPKSPRTKNAVWRRSGELRLESGKVEEPIPDPTPETDPCHDCGKMTEGFDACEKCSPPPSVEAVPVVEKKKRSGNQYGIPSALLKTDKKLYQRLWARCKSQGINYETALKQEGVMKRGKRPEKKAAPKIKQSVKAIALINEVKEPETPSPPATVIRQKINDVIVKQNGPLRAGQRVRHNGSKASPFFGQVGEILKLSADGQAFVKFGESSAWLSPYSVAVVPEVGA